MLRALTPVLALLLLTAAAPLAAANEYNMENIVGGTHCALPTSVACIQDWVAGIEDGRWLELAKWLVCFALGHDCL